MGWRQGRRASLARRDSETEIGTRDGGALNWAQVTAGDGSTHHSQAGDEQQKLGGHRVESEERVRVRRKRSSGSECAGTWLYRPNILAS